RGISRPLIFIRSLRVSSALPFFRSPGDAPGYFAVRAVLPGPVRLCRTRPGSAERRPRCKRPPERSGAGGNGVPVNGAHSKCRRRYNLLAFRDRGGRGMGTRVACGARRGRLPGSAGVAKMGITHRWRKEAGPRLQGSRALDSSKLQAPCVVRIPGGGFRLFYTAVGPAKPFPACQGYILSAVSDDGLAFRTEPGIRLAPQPAVACRCLRLVAPTVVGCAAGRWRMYVEARGPANQPTVICSAVSSDMLHWDFEDGIRLERPGGLGGPRYLPLPDGRG